ncbi:MAG TPA: SRPBCC family protein [Solirubrobacteraceae bacterium]|jgi:hypothetical protein|nr:SRPBCC family protein [Solirubrobacteraceae bacterium]
MKDLRGSATGVTTAPVAECVRFFRAVDRYPDWHPEVVRRVEVLERDAEGEPTRARGVLHAAVGPIVKDFDLVLAITLPDPHTVSLTRVPNHPGDDELFEVVWHLEEGANTTAHARTRIRLDLQASLSVPRLVPVGGIGDRLAEGFMSAATRALET